MQFRKAGKYIIDKLGSELPGHLSYHSIGHVKDVYAAARRIGKSEGISAHEMKLLLTAALYHDSGFLRGAGNHEEESCRIAAEILPGHGYSASDIERIQGMIMATKIPQQPKNLLEQILADADLDYLGRNDFFVTGDRLFNELSISGAIATETQWNQLQVRFLENHRYFTKTSLQTRQEKKQLHLQQIKEKLNQTTNK